MPYRIDISSPPRDALDLLIELGALDVESTVDGLAAILPDSVTREEASLRLDGAVMIESAAHARDDGSVWMLGSRTVRLGHSRTVHLADSDAFGTGYHPTTALCLELLEEMFGAERPSSVLDVGTGSGILALAALTLGVPHATGVDIDTRAVRAAEENARLNQLADRFEIVLGGLHLVDGTWPLILANVLAAPLIEMVPVVARRLGRSGRLILSGIHESLAPEVRAAYEHLGIRVIETRTRGGWTALSARASW